MPFIPKPPFPNVPKLPGVPQLPRSLSFPAGPPPALGLPVAIGRLWQSLFATPQWGIYDSENNLRLRPDSILDMGYRLESNVSDFPVQGGTFASYNKVEMPYDFSLRVVKGGSQQDRANFLSDCEFLARSLSLFTILTPERTYTDANITRLEVQRRGAGGAYFLSEVDLYFKQVRQVAAQYTTYAANTQEAQEPGAQPPTNQGRVQGVTPPQSAAFDPADNLKVNP